MPPRPNPHLLDIAPYPLAGPPPADGRRLILLNQNEAAVPPSAAALQAAHESLGAAQRYIEPSAALLRHAIAEAEGLDADRIICGAGSMELIATLAAAYLGPADEAIVNEFGYNYFRTATQLAGATPVVAPERDRRVDVDAMLDCVSENTRVVFLVNPSNPTGYLLTSQEVARLRAALRDDILLVLDAAYAEFVTDPSFDPGVRLVEAGDNTVMLRTFSKIHGLAGLRVGWGYFPDAIGDILRRVRPPDSMAGPGIAAAIAAIAERGHVDHHRTENARIRDEFSAALGDLGLAPYPSHGNFVLVRFPDGAGAAESAHAHLMSAGIVVRPMASYNLDDCLRITVGDDTDMTAVRDSLAAWMAQGETAS